MLPQVPEGVVWSILLLPLGSLVAIALWARPYPRWSGYLTIGAIALAFLFSLWVLDSAIDADGAPLPFQTHEWLTIASPVGQDLVVNVGLRVDGLTAIMLLVVTAVSLLVQVYSQGYMAGDGGYSRYFAYMSLFTASMLGLLLVDSILLLFVFWELVGLCSYLLIGFWFHRPAAARAAVKAFIVTRLGDLGLLLAIILIWTKTGTFQIAEIQELAVTGAISVNVLTVFALGVFAGAAGKSAQFPLHVWLPDAMEGPTPVSALIHAATMVAAGVYLVARLFPIYEVAEGARLTVAAIGGTTALIAALLGLVVTDIKRVLAYSTISQLGYMMLALGLGGYVAAIFHLFTHAFFKALLFLGSGSVNHATNTFDMRHMGGLRRVMPWTYATFLIASLSLAGVFPFAGFWSKDEILSHAWNEQQALFWLALAVVFLTAFYMFRAVFQTFEGAYQGGEAPEEGHGADPAHPHESPLVMVAPLVTLAVAALLIGLANVSGGVEHLLAGALPAETREALPEFEFNWGIALGSTALALAGIGGAWLFYGARVLSAERVRQAVRPLHLLLERKYFLDDLYEGVLVQGVLYRGATAVLSWFDTYIVDGVANGVGGALRLGSSGLRLLQTGQVQVYGAMAFVGLLIATGLALLLTPL
ncbi:MAG: NADH-quinone oxidoreductase subunit L [Chloroflexi bacterium RBG_16_68_14]|nr:MAG: NADH-quinone oxidoreductase subunit L [Chloroflexi bacterium RBG_16_68_14]